MRKPTWGPVVENRVKSFLKALLFRANEFDDSNDFQFRWEDSDQPQLVVATKRRYLEKLTQLKQSQVYEVIESLKILEILNDNRLQTQGKEDWLFTLKLWSKDPLKNLHQFEQEWQKKRPQQLRKVTVAEPEEHFITTWNCFIPIAMSLGYGSYSQKIPPFSANVKIK